jgi:hypothetical protein
MKLIRWPTGWQLTLWRLTLLRVTAYHNTHTAQFSLWIRSQDAPPPRRRRST